jgi:hypothetical protein
VWKPRASWRLAWSKRSWVPAPRYINANHSYDLPEVMVTPIVGGSAEYLAWIASETTDQLDSEV